MWQTQEGAAFAFGWITIKETTTELIHEPSTSSVKNILKSLSPELILIIELRDENTLFHVTSVLKRLKVLIPPFHLQIKVYIYKMVDSNSHNLKLWIKPEEEMTTDTLIYSEFVRQEKTKFCFVSFVILICLSSLGELRQTASFLGAILVTARCSENKSKSWPPAATSLKSTQTCKTKWRKKRKPEFVWRVFVFTVHLPARRRRLSHLWSVPLTTPQAALVSTETQLPPVWLVQEETNKTRQSSLFWISADWKVSKAARSKVWSTSGQLVSGGEGFVSPEVQWLWGGTTAESHGNEITFYIQSLVWMSSCRVFLKWLFCAFVCCWWCL